MKSVTGNWDRALAGASQGFPGSTVAKNLPRQEDTRDRGSIPDLGRSPTVGNGNPLSILAWEIHGQVRLMGYSPWGCKESGTTEGLRICARACAHTHTHTHTGETGKQATTRERDGRDRWSRCQGA